MSSSDKLGRAERLPIVHNMLELNRSVQRVAALRASPSPFLRHRLSVADGRRCSVCLARIS